MKKFSALTFLLTASVSVAASSVDQHHYYSNGSILSPSFTRKLLLSQECLDDELLMSQDEELDNILNTLDETCPSKTTFLTGSGGSLQGVISHTDMTGCDATPIKEYCDANYKTAKIPDIQMVCSNVTLVNSTDGSLMLIPHIKQSFINNVNCVAKSCPDVSDWSMEDYAIAAEFQSIGEGASCTAEILEWEPYNPAMDDNDNFWDNSAMVDRSTAVFVLSSIIATLAFSLT